MASMKTLLKVISSFSNSLKPLQSNLTVLFFFSETTKIAMPKFCKMYTHVVRKNGDFLRYPALNIFSDVNEAIYFARTVGANRDMFVEMISDAQNADLRGMRDCLAEILTVISRHVSILDVSYLHQISFYNLFTYLGSISDIY